MTKTVDGSKLKYGNDGNKRRLQELDGMQSNEKLKVPPDWKKQVTAKGQAKSISTATLLVDEGGKFSQANVSTAIKKLCEQLITKLKI